MKIDRGVRPFAEMTDGKKRFVDSTVLHLRAIKFVTNCGAIGRVVEAVFQILERQITGDSRNCDWFAVSLDQLVGGAKIAFASLVFRHAKPGITKPVRTLHYNPGNFFGVTAVRPKREEREFFCFTERL